MYTIKAFFKTSASYSIFNTQLNDRDPHHSTFTTLDLITLFFKSFIEIKTEPDNWIIKLKQTIKKKHTCIKN